MSYKHARPNNSTCSFPLITNVPATYVMYTSVPGSGFSLSYCNIELRPYCNIVTQEHHYINYRKIALCFVHGPSLQFNQHEYFDDDFRTSFLEKDDISQKSRLLFNE